MSKEKATISLDRTKAARARALVGAPTTSAVVDLALDRLIRQEQIRQDVAAYRKTPPGELEEALVGIADVAGIEDDTDWAALYEDAT